MLILATLKNITSNIWNSYNWAFAEILLKTLYTYPVSEW